MAVRYYDISLDLSSDTIRWLVAPPLEVHKRRRMTRGDDVSATARVRGVSDERGYVTARGLPKKPSGSGGDIYFLSTFLPPNGSK